LKSGGISLRLEGFDHCTYL